MRFTPSPWKLRYKARQDGTGGTCRYEIYTTDQNGTEHTIAILPGRTDEDTANAHLITSTPNLFEITSALVAFCRTDYEAIARERSCNAEYLQTVDRWILTARAEQILQQATPRMK